MAHAFRIAQNLEAPATPEQVWDAVATGPGLDSWFMGTSEVEPREGGAATLTLAGFTERSTITAWEPPVHLATKGDEAPDGAYHQFEYRIEPRGGGITDIRFEHAGMLGEDWEREYEGLSEGDPMYLRKLVEYVTYFPGRLATPVSAFGPRVEGDKDAAMSVFRRGLGLPDGVAIGDRVHAEPPGVEPIDGVVDEVSASFLGVRTDDALYRFIRGYEGTTLVGHHLFRAAVDRKRAEAAWAAWLGELFARLVR